MNKKDFYQYLKDKIMILDGAMGTLMQKKGMPKGVCPELWGAENEEAVITEQVNYINAGTNAIYTFSLGGNRYKLDEFGLGDRTIELNRRLAQISRKAAGNRAFVAGDIGSTGKFIRPYGDLPFDKAVDAYKEQITGLIEGGVDFLIIETMIDIQEARAAVIAAKELCDLPVCVSMTFAQDGYTLTGTDPVAALVTLQSLGADAVGCNCSTGPEDMIKIIEAMRPYAKIPLLVKPNAGLPRLVDGNTVFDLSPDEFGAYMPKFVELGASMLGGCCGTSPEYIKVLADSIKGMSPVSPSPQKDCNLLSSSRKAVFLGGDSSLAIIGERINPTGKKKLQESLKEGKMSEVLTLAYEQAEKGADILDVNVGMPGINEKEKMLEAVEILSTKLDIPLCIDSTSTEVVEAALRIYPGRALLNSINGDRAQLENLLPVAAKYGAMIIILPLDEKGVPMKAADRKKIVKKVFNEAEKYGYTKQDVVVDGLVMTVSSNQEAALETLELIEWCSRSFGCCTVIGLSNVSFGLPERNWLNSAFYTMAVSRGLTCAIANPSNEILMDLKAACNVLTCRDKNSQNYISRFAQRTGTVKAEAPAATAKTPAEKVYEAVLKGNREDIGKFIKETLESGVSASDIVDNHLIKAITLVGDLYDKKEYFLPQLIMSAETMKDAFGILEPLLEKDKKDPADEKARIVIATVKGDIHDIGKNIVALMLRNYGFKVFDLGKDVDADTIISNARELNADIIALSSLMTTTMSEMKNVIEQAKKENIKCRFMVGGAVVTEQYSEEIGADGYSSDAYGAVKLAAKLSKGRIY